MTEQQGGHGNVDGPKPLIRNEYFGRKWGAPAFDEAVKVPVPFGAVCLFCADLIDTSDSGVFVNAALLTGPTRSPVHIECHLRSVMGPLAHLQQRCSCFGGSEHEPPTRENARAVMAWLISQQPDRGSPSTGFAD